MLHPQRPLVPGALLEKDATLPDGSVPTIGSQADDLFAVLKIDIHNFRRAAIRCRLPIVLEVVAFKAGTTNLLREKSIFNRMIDVFQELAIDLAIDGGGISVRINEQHGNAPGLPVRRC